MKKKAVKNKLKVESIKELRTTYLNNRNALDGSGIYYTLDIPNINDPLFIKKK